MAVNKEQRRLRIRRSIRTKISGTSERPRLSVFRSNKNIYAQIIDDLSGVTIASASSSKVDGKESKVQTSTEVGKEIAKLALEKGITSVVFDRSGYLYHGRVKSLADGAREAGLKF
ncbi:50S ribosomal protein L18 [Adhaeribacter soli]|jgi:large subunit ribosomal protein L18|uniref:Large ribosomal subunit protein uL18 n=1 Tax=Adhaeribacter soli TaxID=2607655 RepID=A0A5N1IZ38_9BACT|nr:50S ribosomal protein L18 [Adhaeribacter soli]KAA9333759.1 50S ribosomal protein L18 [Adhaeribacter soli]